MTPGHDNLHTRTELCYSVCYGAPSENTKYSLVRWENWPIVNKMRSGTKMDAIMASKTEINWARTIFATMSDNYIYRKIGVT